MKSFEKREEDSVIFFSSHLSQRAKSIFLFLHPHYYCVFKADDSQQYHSCTDYYRTNQFKILGDEPAAIRIHSVKFGEEAQSIATKLEEQWVNSEKWKQWESTRVDVMRRAIRLKFDQNPRLLHKLIMTGGRKLVQEDSRDDFWYFNLTLGAGRFRRRRTQWDSCSWNCVTST